MMMQAESKVVVTKVTFATGGILSDNGPLLSASRLLVALLTYTVIDGRLAPGTRI